MGGSDPLGVPMSCAFDVVLDEVLWGDRNDGA